MSLAKKGSFPGPLTRKEALAFPPSPEAYLHASRGGRRFIVIIYINLDN